jgi:hypothetical protein
LCPQRGELVLRRTFLELVQPDLRRRQVRLRGFDVVCLHAADLLQRQLCQLHRLLLRPNLLRRGSGRLQLGQRVLGSLEIDLRGPDGDLAALLAPDRSRVDVRQYPCQRDVRLLDLYPRVRQILRLDARLLTDLRELGPLQVKRDLCRADVFHARSAPQLLQPDPGRLHRRPRRRQLEPVCPQLLRRQLNSLRGERRLFVPYLEACPIELGLPRRDVRLRLLHIGVQRPRSRLLESELRLLQRDLGRADAQLVQPRVVHHRLGLRRRDAYLLTFDVELRLCQRPRQVALVQLRQHLARLHQVARLHVHLTDPAAVAEGEVGLLRRDHSAEHLDRVDDRSALHLDRRQLRDRGRLGRRDAGRNLGRLVGENVAPGEDDRPR